MASSAPNRSLPARAAAILTTAEVAATRVDLNEAWGATVAVDVDFTIGSLTNVIVRFYVSTDGTTYFPLDISGAAGVSYTLTATGTRAVAVSAPGWKFFRATAQGTGTVTSSSLTINYRYLRRGSQ
jgi:hypothetical protein